MSIVLKLDAMLKMRHLRGRELARRLGMSEVNLSNMRCGKLKGVRMDTLSKLCRLLECQPGDLLEYKTTGSAEHLGSEASIRSPTS